MRVVSSDAELRAAILADIGAAMAKAEKQALGDMFAVTEGYYSGSPKKYKRTGLLRQTPRTERAGGDAGFRAYLDTGTGYGTGSKPGMETVLGWAESGAAGLLGHLDWDGAEKNIVAHAEAALHEYFE